MTTKLSEILSLAETYEQELPILKSFKLPEQPFPSWFDHTLLKPEATSLQIEKLCREAREAHFASVCVNPVFLPMVTRLNAGSGVRTCCVLGFPLGAVPARIKKAESNAYLEMGAEELDMVISVGLLKSGQYEAVLEDIQSVVETAHTGKAIVKVIIEACLLSRREKILACLLCKEAGADFVKTSTGMSSGGATVEDVELMRRVVGPNLGVKAAGGIRTLADARAMLKAGANRLGSSAGVKIIQEALSEEKREHERKS